jgi:hypothetical protein
MLPLGRYICDLTEFEQTFVLDQRFAGSGSRQNLFSQFLSATQFLRDKFSADLVERAWVGGGFTTTKKDPTDIDVTFILNNDAYSGLSKTQQGKLGKLLRAGGFKAIGLSVDGFMMVRERIAQPWSGAGLGTEGGGYFPIRGAWDDWWSRDRANVPAGAEPVVADAEPVRGYVEVMI